MTTTVPTDLAHARELDAADPLRGFRDRFVIDDPELAYFDGNSLGRLPHATSRRLEQLVRSGWGADLIRGWDDWLDMPERVGDQLAAALLGARAGEVIVCDSTTVNLYKLASAAVEADPSRRVIVVARDEFPTDRYVLEGVARAGGLTVRWLDADPIEGPQPDDVSAVLDDDVALVVLSLVHYRSAAIADLREVTTRARDVGALVVWDLSHAVGSIPVRLAETGADLAVGCTYKYLDGGPGSPAFLYVRRELQERLRNPIQGWFGQREQFRMGPRYDPEPGIRAWLTGTPGILALAAVEEGVRLLAEAGIDRIRDKGAALTDYAIALHDEWLAPLGFTLGSPRDTTRRGSHVAVRHAAARALTERLVEHRVVPDFREPETIRLGLSPLTTSFEDVHRGLATLRRLAAG